MRTGQVVNAWQSWQVSRVSRGSACVRVPILFRWFLITSQGKAGTGIEQGRRAAGASVGPKPGNRQLCLFLSVERCSQYFLNDANDVDSPFSVVFVVGRGGLRKVVMELGKRR
jgi:hypothetical protein